LHTADPYPGIRLDPIAQEGAKNPPSITPSVFFHDIYHLLRFTWNMTDGEVGNNMSSFRTTLIILFSFLMVACTNSGKTTDEQIDAGNTDAGPENDPIKDAGPDIDETNALFDPEHVVNIQIEMDPKNWEILRYEGRELISVFSGCGADFEYTYFDATATIDTTKIEHVAIRKKGYLGSLSILKPSLKLNFGKFTPGQEHSGMKRMTLNNDRQDPTHTHQVMSYDLFRQAGVIAPRANFARVSVNGEDLGFYTHVESIKKPFIDRHFENNNGNLYEGQSADFLPEIVDTFERKTNEMAPDAGTAKPDRSDLQKVTDALEVNDSELPAALAQVVDIDAFMTFWAMEVIVGHWDGYTGNRNNFYTYHDPTTDLFYFIPWGTDGAFSEEHSFLKETPRSVYAWSHIAYRLYDYPETRAIYHQRLKALLDELWIEDDLLAEVDRIEALASSETPEFESQRDFISNQKKSILDELVDNGPQWPYPLYTLTNECREPAEISGTFDAVWNTVESYSQGEDVTLTLTLWGEKQEFEYIANSAGPADLEETGSMKYAAISFYATRPDNNPLFIQLLLPPSLMKEGDTPFHGFETFGAVYEIDEMSDDIFLHGYIGNGKINFLAATRTDQGLVKGSFSGLVSQ
jgi:spore coat protein H